MSMNVAEVEAALLALSQQDRVAVIRRGLRSLDERYSDVELAEVAASWRSELRRRIASVDDDRAELHDPDRSHAELRAELAARRR